jgi:biopolymer transport protein ExbB
MLSVLLGVFVFGMITTITAITPSPAYAQEEGQPADPKPPEKRQKGAFDAIIHFFTSIGIVFGLLFLVISIGMVALIIILALDLRMGESVPPSFVEEFTDMVNKRQFKQAYEMCRNDSSFIGRVLTAGMGRLQYGIEDAREATFAMVDSVRASKDSWISYLGIIGTLGPLLGLVGTVNGMIGAFRTLGDAEGAPNPQLLAGEISHALVVTLVGVGVAVPAIFFFTYFKNRLTSISVNTANLADDLLTQMYHNSKKAGAPATPAERPASTGVTAKT